MKLIATSILIILTTFFVGCSGFKNKLNLHTSALTSGTYVVTVWSGGQAVRTYLVTDGFVNSEQGSDGWFFVVNGKLVRVSGTVTIEQL